MQILACVQRSVESIGPPDKCIGCAVPALRFDLIGDEVDPGPRGSSELIRVIVAFSIFLSSSGAHLFYSPSFFSPPPADASLMAFSPGSWDASSTHLAP